jgi:hypothetical protein
MGGGATPTGAIGATGGAVGCGVFLENWAKIFSSSVTFGCCVVLVVVVLEV